MVYRLNETTWLQDAGGGAEIFYFLNWAMLTIVLYAIAILLSTTVRAVVFHLRVEFDINARSEKLLEL